jgi:hypothetical protein
MLHARPKNDLAGALGCDAFWEMNLAVDAAALGIQVGQLRFGFSLGIVTAECLKANEVQASVLSHDNATCLEVLWNGGFNCLVVELIDLI